MVFTSECPSKEERRKAAVEALTQLSAYYRSRKLFLPEGTAKKVEDFLSGLYKISIEFMIFVEQRTPGGTEPTKHIEVWTKATDYVNKETTQLITEMEKDFRRLLGMQE